MWNRAAIFAAVAGLLPAMLGVLPSTAAAASDAPGAHAASGPVAPSTDGVFVFLTGTTVLSPSNAWAVGFGGIAGTAFLGSQVLHWNGHQWGSVKILPGVSLDALESVSATSPSDIWGVGLIGDNCLIEHSNGPKWANAPCPYHGLQSELFGVDARTKSDAWAVGSLTAGNGATSSALSEHWNGHHWAQVTVPPVNGTFVQLNSVIDLGPGNVFAVGQYDNQNNVQQPLAEHWNGHAWKRVSVPAFSTPSFLGGISGGTTAGVTAVGAVVSNGHDVPLIERWTGSRFVRVAQPVSSGVLNAVTVLSRTNAYAVGNTVSGKTLAEHYNGKRWTLVSTPNPADGGYFGSIAATPSGSFVVAVGAHGPLDNQRFLLEQGNGRTWRLTRD
jgi:hypothetical protein